MAAVASSAVFGARHAVAPRRVTARNSRVTARTARVSTVVRAMARETDPKKRIVVTGMGLCSVFGNDYDVFYDKLLAGTSGVAEIDRFDIEEFPTKFAAQIRDFDNEGFVDKKNARRMDDCLQYALVSGNKALLDAGLDEEALAKEDLTKIGVLAGSGMGGLTVFQDGVKALVNKGPKKITPFFIPYAITNMGGALLAIEKGFMGPNYSISTACATANYCFHAAANHIRNGEADVIIAGGRGGAHHSGRAGRLRCLPRAVNEQRRPLRRVPAVGQVQGRLRDGRRRRVVSARVPGARPRARRQDPRRVPRRRHHVRRAPHDGPQARRLGRRLVHHQGGGGCWY